jgi:hypothetical protein
MENLVIPDLKQYWNIHNKEREKLGNMTNDWIRPVIYEQEENNKHKNLEHMPLFDLTQLTSEEISLNYFEPNYLTLYPNSNYPFYEDEVNFIL